MLEKTNMSHRFSCVCVTHQNRVTVHICAASTTRSHHNPMTVSGWCGPPSPCLSQGWGLLCGRGQGRGKWRLATGCSEPFCRASGRWPVADRWSTAACWRSHWPAGCMGGLWSAPCCSHGNSSSLGGEETQGKGGRTQSRLLHWPVP